MKIRFDFAILHEGGTALPFRLLDAEEAPCVGSIMKFEIDGKIRLVEITYIIDAVIFNDSIRVPVYGQVVDCSMCGRYYPKQIAEVFYTTNVDDFA